MGRGRTRRAPAQRQAACTGCGGPGVWADFGHPIGFLLLHNKIYADDDTSATVAVVGPPHARTARFLATGEALHPGEGRRRLHRDVCPDHARPPREDPPPQLELDLATA